MNCSAWFVGLCVALFDTGGASATWNDRGFGADFELRYLRANGFWETIATTRGSAATIPREYSPGCYLIRFIDAHMLYDSQVVCTYTDTPEPPAVHPPPPGNPEVMPPTGGPNDSKPDDLTIELK